MNSTFYEITKNGNPIIYLYEVGGDCINYEKHGELNYTLFSYLEYYYIKINFLNRVYKTHSHKRGECLTYISKMKMNEKYKFINNCLWEFDYRYYRFTEDTRIFGKISTIIPNKKIDYKKLYPIKCDKYASESEDITIDFI